MLTAGVTGTGVCAADWMSGGATDATGVNRLGVATEQTVQIEPV